MGKPKLIFIIGYGGSQIPLLSRVVDEESKEHAFEGVVVNSERATRYKDALSTSDAVFLYTHALPEDVEDAIKNSTARIIISASDSFVHLVRGDPDAVRNALIYFRYGGERNLRNMVHIILKSLGVDVAVEPVEEVPLHGVYHPTLGVFENVDEYLDEYRRVYGSRPMVGILFHRTYWLSGDTKYVDDLVEALESEGLGVIPVFTTGWRYEDINSPTKEDSIREFFLRDGEPRIEALVNLTFFFLLDHGAWHRKSERFKVVQGVELLKRLNVPVISVAMSSYKSVDEWLGDPQGLDYLSQVYTVIMPEVDGLIEPIYYAGSKVDERGVKRYEAYKPHATYIARRVKKWVELRRKAPSERRIAIVLINPPCKGLEANVAVGFGLDPLESIVRTFQLLRSEA